MQSVMPANNVVRVVRVVGWTAVVSDTQSDSIQFLNFAKK